MTSFLGLRSHGWRLDEGLRRWLTSHQVEGALLRERPGMNQASINIHGDANLPAPCLTICLAHLLVCRPSRPCQSPPPFSLHSSSRRGASTSSFRTPSSLTFAHRNGETRDALSSCALMYDFAPRMATASLEADAIAFAIFFTVWVVPTCTCVCPAQVTVFGQIVCAVRCQSGTLACGQGHPSERRL